MRKFRSLSHAQDAAYTLRYQTSKRLTPSSQRGENKFVNAMLLIRRLSRFVGLLLVAWLATAGLNARTVVSLAELQSKDTTVIGALGLPLGSIFEVEGTIVPARASLGLLYNSYYLLRVESVNGAALAKPVIMWFEVKDPQIKMPASIPELAKQQLGRENATDEETDRLERAYVGTRYKVTVVENGKFDGLPRNMPDYCSIWSAPPYGFTTYLVVIGKKPEPAK